MNVYDLDFVVRDIQTKSKTDLLKLEKTYVPLLSCQFSTDGTLLAIADGNARKVHLWKRNAPAKSST